MSRYIYYRYIRKGLLVRKGCFAAGIVAALALPAMAVGTAFAQGGEPAGAGVSPQRALLDRYCVTCHNTSVSWRATAPA